MKALVALRFSTPLAAAAASWVNRRATAAQGRATAAQHHGGSSALHPAAPPSYLQQHLPPLYTLKYLNYINIRRTHRYLKKVSDT